VARFGDHQTVIGMRQGLRLTVLEKLRGLDTTQVAMRTMMHMRQQEPRSCVVDGDGIGGGVADYIRLHGAEWMEKRKAYFRLEEFHGGNTPGDRFMYFNRRAEVWGMMRDWLVTAEIPDDPELEADLTGPEYFFSSKNQIQLTRGEKAATNPAWSPDGRHLAYLSNKTGYTAGSVPTYALFSGNNPLTLASYIAAQGNGGRVASQIYHDVLLKYQIGTNAGGWGGNSLSGIEVQLNLRNVFNHEPPFDAMNTAGFYSVFGDPRLASYSLTLKKKF